MISDCVYIQRTLSLDDRHAFNQLVLRHQSKLRQVLRRLCKGDEGLADDLAQETFLQAYKSLAQFRQDSKFSTWLYRIAYNKFVSSQRKTSEQVDQLAVDNYSPSYRPAHSAGIDVQRAISTLNDSQREAVYLCLGDGCSHSEAAQAMNIPVGTLKTHILRARKKLQQQLSVWCGGTEHES